MNKFNQDIVLVIAALTMVCGVVGYAWWGIGTITASLGAALNVPPPSKGDLIDINIDGAKKILTEHRLLGQ